MADTRSCALRSARRFITVALFGCLAFAVPAQAALIGTTPLPPGGTVTPGLTSAPAGTLLASLSDPYTFTTTAGTTSGTLSTAVYRESNGLLDFYYQIDNAAASATPIDRLTAVNFGAFSTDVGYRIDGASLPGGVFVNGSVAPVTADRNGSGSTGSTVGFSFSPPDSSKVQPGSSSNVLVISTNATNFAAGNATIIDGGAQTVAAFQPAPIPEPASLALLAVAALPLACTSRKRTARQRR